MIDVNKMFIMSNIKNPTADVSLSVIYGADDYLSGAGLCICGAGLSPNDAGLSPNDAGNLSDSTAAPLKI
jgi:hypothetical protein